MSLKDEQIEQLWEELDNIPFDENDQMELILAEDWNGFERGTDRNTIWQWFNEQHSKGIVHLMELR